MGGAWLTNTIRMSNWRPQLKFVVAKSTGQKAKYTGQKKKSALTEIFLKFECIFLAAERFGNSLRLNNIILFSTNIRRPIPSVNKLVTYPHPLFLTFTDHC